MKIMKKDLDNVKTEWNTHVMRKNKKINVPTGKPNYMWMCPHAYGNYRKHTFEVGDSVIDHLHKRFGERGNARGVTEDVREHLLYVMEEHNLTEPTNIDEALSLYRNMIRIVKY